MYREKQLEQEERMAKELSRINFEKQREKKIRQYIKENRYTYSFHYLDLCQHTNATPFLLCCLSLLWSLHH